MTIAVAKRRCPVCCTAEVEPLHRQEFVLLDQHPLSDGYDVVVCASCGFVYADTDAAQTHYDAFYTGLSKYEDTQTSTGSGHDPYDARRLQGTAVEISKMLPSSVARILEVGCGNGGLLRALKLVGFSNVVGMDPSAACVRRLQAEDIPAFQGTLNALPASLGQFDCVILNHVLEHVLDPRISLANLKPFLSRDAFLYIEVPDALKYRKFNYAPFQEFNTEHINHFSEVSLLNLIGLAGFNCLSTSTKLIEISERTYYPALSGFARSKADVAETYVAQKDAGLRRAIIAYLEGSQNLMRSINSHLSSSLAKFPRVIVWGTGQLAMKLLSQSALCKVEIARFVDSNPIYHRRTLTGIPIVGPSEISGHPEPIVVASVLHDKEITATIRSLGLRNHVIHLTDGSRGEAILGVG